MTLEFTFEILGFDYENYLYKYGYTFYFLIRASLSVSELAQITAPYPPSPEYVVQVDLTSVFLHYKSSCYAMLYGIIVLGKMMHNGGDGWHYFQR